MFQLQKQVFEDRDYTRIEACGNVNQAKSVEKSQPLKTTLESSNGSFGS
jgi:hypothetical protein